MSAPVDSRWWSDDYEGRRHEAVVRVVRSIRQNQEYRKVDDLLHASLYGNLPMMGFGLGSVIRQRSANTSRLSLNVVRNMVGAVTSKVAAKNKPKPTFLTEGGDYELRQKAEKLEKFVGGVFYESGIYPLLTKCFRDACVYGTGFLKIHEDGKKVCVERVIPWEIVVDDAESIYAGSGLNSGPRSIYQRKYVDKLVAIATWVEDPESEEGRELTHKLEAAKGSAEDAEYAYQSQAEQILVTEAWHLGETDDVPGRHCIVIDGATLLDEPWEGPFPFSVIRWSEPVAGYFGIGLAEELVGIQNEINKLLLQIQRGHHLITGHWLVDQGSKVSTAHINNDLASIVKYTGIAPQYNAPNAIAPDVYQHLWAVYQKAFEIAGISQDNATGSKPAGLNSGVAQRTYQDIQTERFLEVGQNYEEFVIEAARQVVRRAKAVGGKYRVRAVDKQRLEFVDWSEIDLAEDLYVIRVYPTSMLPTTPAGRLQWAQDMIQAGVIPPEDVLDIVDFPDTEAYARRKNAPRKLIERNIAHILKTGEFISPEPFDNHALAMRLTNEAYHEARLDGVPEDRLELLRRYMADSVDLAQPPPAPAPMTPPGDMPPPMPGPGPMGPPGMPPMPPMGPPLQ